MEMSSGFNSVRMNFVMIGEVAFLSVQKRVDLCNPQETSVAVGFKLKQYNS